VVLAAVLLWLLYLLPSIMQRSRYDAAERNALRLNRALRVLAETSETPDEVRVELSARQARQQQKAAVKAQAEVDRLRRERDELEADQARLERDREASELEERRHEIASEQARLERREAERALEAQRLANDREAGALMRAEARRHATARETIGAATAPGPMAGPEDERGSALSEKVAATRAAGVDVDRARVRRRVRLVATLVAFAGIVVIGWGAALLAQGVAFAEWAGFIAGGVAMVAVAVSALRRMGQVARRAAARRPAAQEAERTAARATGSESAVRRESRGEQALLNPADRGWTPRSVPAPMSTSAGSSAASAADARTAREQLLAAAREEGLRERVEQLNPAPVSIEIARTHVEKVADEWAPAVAETAAPEAPFVAEPSPYAAMGYIDDAEIDDHLSAMLGRRVG